MAKGIVGTNTSTVIHVKKPKKVSCECSRCRHSTGRDKSLYCTYYDIISPKRKSCVRYWCVKPVAKKAKKKRNYDHKKSTLK